MKKNLLIGILTLISVFSIAFGYQQKVLADKYKQMAEENEREAREQVIRAQQALEQSQKRAMAEAEAMRQQALANQK